MPDYLRLDWASQEVTPFKITKYEDESKNSFYVKPGVCYSTYSLETGSFLNIENLNSRFDWGDNQKVFIEVDVGINLGIKNAKIKIEQVGPDAPDDGWGNYPYFYKIEPQDDFDETGKVIKIRDSKKQTKCYVLIGYLKNDTLKNGTPSDSEENSEESNDEYVPVQILKENVIFVQSVVSGIPCLAPFPYFRGGLTHLESINKDLQYNISNSSSSSSNSDNSSSSTSSN